ncbi:MAG: DUF3107 domain-containing protein [Sporichthyaceae bacterium]
MEVKVGVQNSPRELTVESALSAEEVEAAVKAALADGSGLLSLVDDRGRKLLIPADKLSYVEIGETEIRRVGFGAL